jgi:hypothetical protein
MVTKRPTTTGGSPMPVLMRLTVNRLPGNLESAMVVPMEIPMNRLISVAVPDTWSERRVIPITSGSKVIKRKKAFLRPSRMRSTFYSNPAFGYQKFKCQNPNAK